MTSEMFSRKWKTIEGEVVTDVCNKIKEVLVDGEREVHIGADSQQCGKFTEYVVVIVLLQKGKGGRAFYSREKIPRVKSLRERLIREVWMSVSTALEFEQKIGCETSLTIHVDANPNLKFKSSSHVKELTAMVVSQGFKSVLKPDSWAASHLADHIVKNKVIRL